MSTLLIVLLVVILLGGVGPWWGYSRGWGYYPFGGGLSLIVLVLVILALTGRL